MNEKNEEYKNVKSGICCAGGRGKPCVLFQMKLLNLLELEIVFPNQIKTIILKKKFFWNMALGKRPFFKSWRISVLQDIFEPNKRDQRWNYFNLSSSATNTPAQKLNSQIPNTPCPAWLTWEHLCKIPNTPSPAISITYLRTSMSSSALGS